MEIVGVLGVYLEINLEINLEIKRANKKFALKKYLEN